MYYDDGIGDGGWRWIDNSLRLDDIGGGQSGQHLCMFFTIHGFFVIIFFWDRDLTRDLGSAGGSTSNCLLVSKEIIGIDTTR